MSGTGRGRYGGRPLAHWVDGCLAPALARFGFGEVDIVSGWADIVGPRVAACAEPVEVRWPRRGGTGKTGAGKTGAGKTGAGDTGAGGAAVEPGGGRPSATLVVRVEGAFALELQHLAPSIVERINAHVGWRCIGKLALRQAPLVRRAPTKLPAAPPRPAALAAARDLTAGIDDEGLRTALVRLGGRALRP